MVFRTFLDFTAGMLFAAMLYWGWRSLLLGLRLRRSVPTTIASETASPLEPKKKYVRAVPAEIGSAPELKKKATYNRVVGKIGPLFEAVRDLPPGGWFTWNHKDSGYITDLNSLMNRYSKRFHRRNYTWDYSEDTGLHTIRRHALAVPLTHQELATIQQNLEYRKV